MIIRLNYINNYENIKKEVLFNNRYIIVLLISLFNIQQ